MSKKTTKRALAMSFVSVFLCVCMLVGTTFAWFTDSVTSSNNIIKSGTLDVTMHYANGDEVPASASWNDASTTKIFNYDKWEPGYVDVKHIKIENKGTLALKYQLNIIPNGVVSELANVIDVYYLDPAQQIADRTQLPADKKLGTLTEALAGMATTASGNLKAGESHTVTIALKMKEDATNEYQGLSIGSDFSVVLMATQKDYESDSFDNTYDDIDVPNKDIKVIDGNTYYYYNNAVVALREVPYDNVGTTFTVPDGVTVIGIAKDKNDTDGPVFSKYSSVESITLPEGVTEINARAINMKTLTSINFPSTLTYIGEQAFRQTGMSELTIPANVKVIDEGAFRDMANLTTVTVEGNVAFDDYAFRSCPNLTSIYLLGDDVTFADDCVQFATHQDTGYSNPLTIYVKNATVAARVYAAQSSATDYEVKILGAAADGSDAQAITQVNTPAKLKDALAAGTKNVIVKEATFTEKISLGPDVNATFVNCTISGNNNWGYVNNATYENCTFDSGSDNAAMHFDQLYGELVVRNCTFKSGKVQIGTDGSSVARFENCTFVETTSTSIWAEKGMRFYCPTTFTNCEFNNRVVLAGSNGLELTFENCTMNGGSPVYYVDNSDGIIRGGNVPTVTIK